MFEWKCGWQRWQSILSCSWNHSSQPPERLMSISTSDISGATLSMESMESYDPQYQSPVRMFGDEIKDVEMEEFSIKPSTHPSKLHVKGIAWTFSSYRYLKRHIECFGKVKKFSCCLVLRCADILFENRSAAIRAKRKGWYLTGNGCHLTMFWYTEPSPTISGSERYEAPDEDRSGKKWILVSLMPASLLEDQNATNQEQASLLQQEWCFEIVLEVELSYRGGWCGEPVKDS